MTTLIEVKALAERLDGDLKPLQTLIQYCDWTVGPESPGHHPTMPSAIGAARAALNRLANRLAPQAPANLSLVDAFEMGYEWRGQLIGSNIEDSRAVGRTLGSVTFSERGLEINLKGFNSFDTADNGIYDAKQRIHADLRRAAPVQAEPVALAEVSDHIRLAVLVKTFRKRDGRGNFYMPVNKCVKELLAGWRCFYCNKYFTTKETAAEHFGNDQSIPPKCCDASPPTPVSSNLADTAPTILVKSEKP